MKRQPIPEQRDEISEKIAWLTEGIFRIGPYRVGLDPIIGLVPGAGDLVTALAAIVIVQRGIALGIPRGAIARMTLNVVIDAVVGAIPFLGDLFDFAFKANTKNLGILRESIRGERRAGRDWLFVGAVMVTLVAALILPILVLYWVAQAVITSRV
ncbi:MAG TPA: DUF4112 domain-containing protein [Bryobacteraceae bacterium]|nr:DUF4112 domain-containing protein [Bryobacteraceae bacterium]